MKKIFLLINVILLWAYATNAQTSFTIKGFFPEARRIQIRLMGNYGTKETLISQTTADSAGNFVLTYPENYSGAALLQVKERSSLLVLLHRESFTITWPDFKDLNSITFSNSKENAWFQKAYTINTDAQKKLAGLTYLLPMYTIDSAGKSMATTIENEIKVQADRFAAYRQQLPAKAYVKDYVGYRAVLQQLQNEKLTRNEATAAIIDFFATDFSNTHLYCSGLIKELLDAGLKKILLLSGNENPTERLNAFSATLKKSTQGNPVILNDYSGYLIQQYERYNLTAAAEYLALSLLDDKKCIIDNKRMPVLEQYKKMAIGNQAPELVFSPTTGTDKLTDLKAAYKVIVFGASWCEECKKELPQLKEYASLFKTKYDAQIVFVSIDTDTKSFTDFAQGFPFISICDYKGWEGVNVKSYYVFATPTIFILDARNTIVAKPVNAVDAAKWLFNHKPA